MSFVATAENAPDGWRSRNAIALDEIENPIVRKGLEAWQHVRGNRRMPARAELGPRALRGLLSHVAVVRVIGGGEEFEFRIVGDDIRVQQGVPLQGKRMADVEALLPAYGTVLKRIYRDAYEAAEPRAFRGWYTRPADNHPFFHEVVIMPVGDDGETVDHLIVVAA
jgi:hypothetical protein